MYIYLYIYMYIYIYTYLSIYIYINIYICNIPEPNIKGTAVVYIFIYHGCVPDVVYETHIQRLETCDAHWLTTQTPVCVSGQ